MSIFWRLVAAAALGLPLGLAPMPAVSQGQAVDAAVVTFQYSQGAFTNEFVDWVAHFGARTPFAFEPGATVEDYARTSCGPQPGQNADLIRRSLVAQGYSIDEDGTISPPADDSVMLPPCLPVEIEKARGNVSLPGDSFSVITGPKVRWSGNPLIEQKTLEQLFPTGTGGGDQRPFTIQSGGDFDYSEITAKDYLKSVTTPDLSDSEVAFNIFLTGKTLQESGVDPGIAKLSVLQSLGEIAPIYGTDQAQKKFEIAYDNAMIRYGSQTQITAQDLWGASGQLFPVDTDLVGASQVDWLAPFPNLKRPTQLDAGEIIFTKEPVQQSVNIPIDGGLLQKGAASAADFVQAELPSISDDPDNPIAPGITQFAATPFDAIGDEGCPPSDVDGWGLPGFGDQFLSAVVRNRLLAQRVDSGSRYHVRLVIIDSGFVKTADRDPFRNEVFTSGEWEDQLADKQQGDGRGHGTAVAGLTLGGPQLWGLPSTLGIELKIMPRRIYDRPLTLESGQVVTPVNFDNMFSAFEKTADIYNLSFAAFEERSLDRFIAYQGDFNKLFVIAAGNNGMNDGIEGANLNTFELFPQQFGGDGVEGSNIIVVAAVDGNGDLADFSNYSNKHVSLAAPGCRIASWAPDANDTAFVVQHFTGTSFSAPIVAYVAALVHALAPENSATSQWIRLRLLASADLVRGIEGIEDGRRLNPAKAVAVFEDVVELTDPREPLRFGHLQVVDRSLTEFCAGTNLPEGARLLKIARDPTDETRRRLVFYFTKDPGVNGTRLLSRDTCEPKNPTFAMTDTNSGRTDFISFADIKDIVFRMN